MEAKLLKAKMIIHSMTIDEICKQTSMSKSAFYRKCKGVSEFTQSEISKIAVLMDLTAAETFDIFFSQKVS